MGYPSKIQIVDVAPRDGLQNEPGSIPIDAKLALIEGLANAGVGYIEAGSFVSPKWVPQMADSEAVFQNMRRKVGVTYAALTPNLKGFERAIEAGTDEVAVFAAASETFSQKNINCSIQESLERFVPVVDAAKKANIPVRGYISCVLGCPYEGEVSFDRVAEVALRLYAMGCREVSLGDTIGRGTPAKAQEMVRAVSGRVPVDKLAAHFHDTYGQALANLLAVMEAGIAVIDASVAGLGGCPYAQGASGNVATEDIVYMLDGMDIETGIDLDRLVACGKSVSTALGRTTGSKVGQAWVLPEEK